MVVKLWGRPSNPVRPQRTVRSRSGRAANASASRYRASLRATASDGSSTEGSGSSSPNSDAPSPTGVSSETTGKSTPHFFELFVRPTRSLARFPTPAFLLRSRPQAPLGSRELLGPFPQPLWDPYHAALGHRCSSYCLLDPPRGIGRELHPLIGVVTVHRLHER